MAEKEYIEREAALAFQNEVEPILCRNVVTHDITSATKDTDLVKYLQSIPTADVRPAVRGKWDMYQDGSGVCSVCGKAQFQHWEDGKPDKFCHNCGAAMEES